MGVLDLFITQCCIPRVKRCPITGRNCGWRRMLFESALNFTILQPAVYMQNILGSRESLFKEGVYPYLPQDPVKPGRSGGCSRGGSQYPYDSGHDRAIYELSGREAPTQTEVASAITRIIGRPVRAKQLPIDSWRRWPVYRIRENTG